MTFPALKNKVTPEAGDKYIQASIMIPYGNTFTCRTIVSCKRNAEGHIIGCAHDNPVIGSHVYDVEFANSKVTALTANAIAKAMYAQCDPDWMNSSTSSALLMPDPRPTEDHSQWYHPPT